MCLGQRSAEGDVRRAAADGELGQLEEQAGTVCWVGQPCKGSIYV